MFETDNDQGAHGSVQTYDCRLCGHTGNTTTHVAWEMMFGLGESFTYFECDSCGSLQIDHIPQDMSPYYPEHYYSLATRDSGPSSGWRKVWDRTSAMFSLRGPNHLLPAVKHREIYEWLKNAGVHFQSSILDVGCGSGALLLRLRNDGFTDLTGYEPHIQETLSYEGNVTVHNQVDHVKGRFDLVMLHHSLEHMPDQHRAFKRLAQWVKPGGKLLLRIPVYPNAAWDEYGVNWFQLDAPRHFYLHSEESIRLVADQAGFEDYWVHYDSKGSQFWASEQYKQGIFHRSPTSHAESPSDSIFSTEQLREYARKSREANRAHHGDAACFLFQRKAS